MLHTYLQKSKEIKLKTLSENKLSRLFQKIKRTCLDQKKNRNRQNSDQSLCRWNVYTFSCKHMCDSSAADNFYQHCGKSRNCSQWALSQCFQLFLIIVPLFIDIFHSFCQALFKVTCCKLVVCGKALNTRFYLTTHFSLPLHH